MPAVTHQLQTASAEQTVRLAQHIASALRPGEIIMLDGALGSGKTQFVRGLARGLAIDATLVSSPTFVICQQYDVPRSNDSHDSHGEPPPTQPGALMHIDAYRLTGPEELDTIGFDEMLADESLIIAIEWPTRIAQAIPFDRAVLVRFSHVDEHQRLIEFTAPHGGSTPSQTPQTPRELDHRITRAINTYTTDIRYPKPTNNNSCQPTTEN